MRASNRQGAFVLAAGVLVGLAAELVGFGWRDAERWAPDLAVGWVLIGFGTVAWLARPTSRTGLLLIATGFAWFVPNFAGIQVPILASLAAFAASLHRGLLIHALLTYPTGRLTSWVERTTVIGAYVAVILPALAGDLVIQGILGAVLIAVAIWRSARAIGRERRARAWAVPAAAALGLSLVGVALGRLIVPSLDVETLSLLAYQAVLCGVAVWLVVGLIREPWRQAAVTDLVVELGDARAASVRDTFALALGDPTLEVGYAIEGTAGYIDAMGRPLAIPAPGTGRIATPIDLDGRPVGILVYDAAVLDDPGLMRSIAEAARLGASNARLQAEVRAQIADVEASRRRLVDAEEDERGRIQERLRAGTVSRLQAARATLREAETLVGEAGPQTAADRTLERTRQAAWQLDRTLDDLRDLAFGLDPHTLDASGLDAALLQLAEGAPIPVDIEVPAGRLSSRVASAAYFVCSEAIANVVKHADASHASIQCHVADRRLLIVITDDGAGGADPSGPGLRGLADRLEAVGGDLTVDSPAGAGTRLTAALPLDSEA